MKIVFFGKGNRGVACLKVLLEAGYNIPLVVVHPEDESPTSVSAHARQVGIRVIAPEDPNSREMCELLAQQGADLFVLGGYGKILHREIIEIPKIMSINLHGGKLPQYRGSSPMNWALINSETSFTISIIKVDTGVDTGPLLAERTFPIRMNDSIVDLHAIADAEFPILLKEVVAAIKTESYQFITSDQSGAGYFPLRFPEDGFILWDMYSAQQIHNRIRALTDPYPGAFTLFQGRKIKLLRSELTDIPYYGEPGRIYQKSERGLLICASDRCLLATKAVFEDDGTDVFGSVRRYDRFATVRETAQLVLRSLHQEQP